MVYLSVETNRFLRDCRRNIANFLLVEYCQGEDYC
jgi:hypothetical protein